MMKRAGGELKGGGWQAAKWLALLATVASLASRAGAQAPAPVVGTVVDSVSRLPVAAAQVALRGSNVSTRSDSLGRFVLVSVPSGDVELQVHRIGYDPRRVTLRATERNPTIAMLANAQRIASVFVTAPSRAPGRLVDAPAAVSLVDPAASRHVALSGQAAKVLETVPGVDVVHSGISDFNVNARGLNTTLNRRVLVLQDGRDLSLAFNGAQEWLALSTSIDDFKRIEMVRGPGSALYGANAYNGVLALTSPLAREELGTRLRVAGGGLGLVRTDVRHAATFGDSRWAYRLSLGGSRSDTWTRSRTQLGDIDREYEPTGESGAAMTVPPPGYEFFPLAGQRKEGAPAAPGPSIGTRDPITSGTATLRLDRYFDGARVLTTEGGVARVAHETGLTALGRLQIGEAWRPWARLAYDSPGANYFLYYSARQSSDQVLLASGSEIDEESSILHGEGQGNRSVFNGSARVIGGASARVLSAHSRESLLGRGDEGGTHWSGAVFGQIEADLRPSLQLVISARGDVSQLHYPQFSPRGALVWSATPTQSLRVSVGRAFQTPTVLEYFLNVPVSSPVNLTPVENGLRNSPLGGALSDVPPGTLFTTSSSVPVRAIGNSNLDVERVTSYEAGYKAEWGERAFVTADAYFSRLSQFVTDLLPGANPAYASWLPPSTVPAPVAGAVAAAVRAILTSAGQPLAAMGLSRLDDGRTAIIISLGNAGEATAYGVELGAGIEFSDRVRVDGAYAFARTDVDESSLVAGDIILANTPRHKGHAAISIAPTSRMDTRLSATFVARHPWASGLFAGDVPSRQTVDGSLSWRVFNSTELHASVFNLFDQKRYQLVGGSVAGRLIVAGITIRSIE
jgi:outer membrane receptor protein involved in Fe transport